MKGFTLIECLVTLAILSILLSLSAGSLTQQANKWRIKSETQRLAHLIKLTRSEAVTYNTTAALCPIMESGSCSRDWRLPIALFHDHNANGKIDNEDKLVKKVRGSANQLSVRWRSPSKRIQYNLKGHIKGSIGSLDLCHNTGERTSARALIVSMGGRVRSSQDFSGNGIHESGNGRDIECK